MKARIIGAAMGIAIAMPALSPDSALARDRDRDGRRDYRCEKSSGTTGLIVGGAGGALAGNAVGGGTLGTVAGGVGGALLGKHIDKKNHEKKQRRRGC